MSFHFQIYLKDNSIYYKESIDDNPSTIASGSGVSPAGLPDRQYKGISLQ